MPEREVSKIELNVHLKRLTEGWNLTSARIVVANLHNPPHELNREKELEMIGDFEIWRIGKERAKFFLICFRDLHKALKERGENGKGPMPFHGIEYHTNTLEPYALAVWEWVNDKVSLISILSLIELVLNPHYRRLILRLLPRGETGITFWKPVPTYLYGKPKSKIRKIPGIHFYIKNIEGENQSPKS